MTDTRADNTIDLRDTPDPLELVADVINILINHTDTSRPLSVDEKRTIHQFQQMREHHRAGSR